MSIEVCLAEPDYRCLLENVDKHSSMHDALLHALNLTGARTTRRLVCGVLDVIRLSSARP